MKEISPVQAAQALATGNAVLLDVREDWELAVASVPGATHIPMNQIPQRLHELDTKAPIFVMCHSGVRSRNVTAYLAENGFDDAQNVTGGITAWSETCDPGIPIY